MTEYLDVAIAAAREAGALLRSHFGVTPDVKELFDHDIKIELDERTQALIAERLLTAFPGHAFLGEEGIAGDQASDWHWIVDPIDGTVNFFYGIPHFCVSIALRHREEIVVGVIYDPMRDELWATTKDGTPTLNDQPIRVSQRNELREAVVSIGFAKSKSTIAAGIPLVDKMIGRVRKVRLMGSAALDLAYVACGRLDAYIESSVSLWDVAAGKLLVERAGGLYESAQREDAPGKISVRASSGLLALEV
jgi:myo-inositol-1(or 4)-monophosphatase